jgi:hypothetical protein
MTVHAERRFVDNGRVVCSAGIAAGIDMTLHVIGRLLRQELAEKTALAEKKATAQLLAGVNTRHGPQPPVYPSTVEVVYVAALKKADVDGLVAGLEKEIDQLQDRLDQFNHDPPAAWGGAREGFSIIYFSARPALIGSAPFLSPLDARPQRIPAPPGYSGAPASIRHGGGPAPHQGGKRVREYASPAQPADSRRQVGYRRYR